MPSSNDSNPGLINIFVGNVGPQVTEEQLLKMFLAYGAVESVTLVKDRNTGQARGMAFVEMRQPAEARAAIANLNGYLLHEQPLRVNEARSKMDDDLMRPSSDARAHRRHRI